MRPGFDSSFLVVAKAASTFVLLMSIAGRDCPALAQQPTGNAPPPFASAQNAVTVQADKRIALAIGNNAYSNFPKLDAAINDARAIADTLTELGFSVTLLQDANRRAMELAIDDFADKMRAPRTVGLFYFSGHGVQSRSKNFMLPIDEEIKNEDQIETQGIDLQGLLDKMALMREGMGILVLDACRDNPFAKSGPKRPSGLAAIDGPPGTLLAFAAAPGQQAREQGANGVFTKNLIANIGAPGIPVEEVFKRVRTGVIQETGGIQIPWENTSLVRDFYFRPAAPGKGFRQIEVDSEAVAWASIAGSRNLYDFTGFHRRYPESRYGEQLLSQINSILAQRKPPAPPLTLDELPLLHYQAYAGLWIGPLNKYYAEFVGLGQANGVLATKIERGSVAERAGLRQGDVVLSVNGNPIVGVEDFAELSRTIIPGESVEAVVWRNGKEISVSGEIQRASIIELLRSVAWKRLAMERYDQARVLCEYLARVDDPAGQGELGFIHLYGLGVTPDILVAESWLMKAAQGGNTGAANLLAQVYANAESGIEDHPEAFRWAKVSAEAGDHRGAALLGAFYLGGIGAEQDVDEGVRWTRYAAERGDTLGMLFLAAAYESGTHGLALDIEQAKKWYRRASEFGAAPAAEALNRLGE